MLVWSWTEVNTQTWLEEWWKKELRLQQGCTNSSWVLVCNLLPAWPSKHLQAAEGFVGGPVPPGEGGWGDWSDHEVSFACSSHGSGQNATGHHPPAPWRPSQNRRSFIQCLHSGLLPIQFGSVMSELFHTPHPPVVSTSVSYSFSWCFLF